jgi:hypothetical protein
MMTGEGSKAANGKWPGFGPVIAGYFAGCCVATLGFGGLLAALSIEQSVGLAEALKVIGWLGGLVFVGILMTAWPGFIALRLVLHLLGQPGWAGFAVAGALNAVVTKVGFDVVREGSFAIVLQNPPEILIPLIGVFAGLAAWMTERRLAYARSREGE